jgi:hypothetical protein
VPVTGECSDLDALEEKFRRFPLEAERPGPDCHKRLHSENCARPDYRSFAEAAASGSGAACVEIPMLRLDAKADPNYKELFQADDPIAQQYLRARQGVVRITSPAGKDKERYGSGFFISPDGKIATAGHVINDASGPIVVDTADGGRYRASVVETRPTTDVAILKVEPQFPGQTFPALPLAPTGLDLQPGQRLYALGHPNHWQDIFLSVGNFDGFRSGQGLRIRRVDDGRGIFAWWRNSQPANPEKTAIRARYHTELSSSGGPVLSDRGVLGLVRAGKSLVTPVDDLHQMLGNRPPAPLVDYFFPRRVNFDEDTAKYGAAFLLSSYDRLKPGLLSRFGTMGVAAAGILLGTVRDGPFFMEAMRTGTTAEKANATIDVAADAMMMSGFLSIFVPRWRAVAAAAQMAGSGIKLVNNLLSDRHY